MTIVKIYTLLNPIENNIFYVGKTIDLELRLANHIGTSKNGKSEKDFIIKSILKEGCYPIIEEIDRYLCFNKNDERIANETEIYWMHQISSWGFRICNDKGFVYTSERIFRKSSFGILSKLKSDKYRWFYNTINQIKEADNLTFDQKTYLVTGFIEEKEKWTNKFKLFVSNLPTVDDDNPNYIKPSYEE